MKKIWLLPLFAFTLIIYTSCKGKSKTNDYWPVLSFIGGQVRLVDSSLNSIMKIERMDSDTTWDTSYIRHEEFRALAHDFLETPDLTNNSIGKNYKEEKTYDPTLDRIIYIYTPIKGEPELIRQEVVIAPQDTSYKIRSIIFEKIKDQKDSVIHQRLLWLADEKFQVVNIIEKNGQPVSSKTTEVIWNKQDE